MAFIKRGDAICKSQSEKRIAQLQSFTVPSGVNPASAAAQEEAVEAIALPSTRAEMKQLSELRPPTKDRAQVRAILGGLRRGIAKMESEPILAVTKPGVVFPTYDKLAIEYGFKTCGRI